MPPQIHRRLTLSLSPHGLVLRPKSSAPLDKQPSRLYKGENEISPGVLMHWGVKGKVEVYDRGAEEDDTVDLGGILGIVRLWDGTSI